MGNEQDVFEWRRFGHWKTTAENARFSAFMLWHMRQEPRLSEVVRECAYSGGDADLAVLEAFRRESAVALELVVKAVIAPKLEARSTDTAAEYVPANHDIPRLRKEAP